MPGEPGPGTGLVGNGARGAGRGAGSGARQRGTVGARPVPELLRAGCTSDMKKEGQGAGELGSRMECLLDIM